MPNTLGILTFFRGWGLQLRIFYNRFRQEVILGFVAFLLTTTSLALGYLLAAAEYRAPIIIQRCDLPVSETRIP